MSFLNRNSKNSQVAKNRKGASRSGVSAHRNWVGNMLVGKLSTIFIACLLAAGLYGFYKATPYMNPAVEQVIVEGELVRLDRAKLTQAVYSNLQGGILTLDIDLLGSKIAQIAWVEQVEVVKYFPSILVVRIVEEQAIARWNDQGYISNFNEFIESDLYEDLAGLPLLTSAIDGIEPERAARDAVEIFHSLNSTALMNGQNIRELRQSASGGWSMVWANGLSIDIGRVDHLNRTKHAMAAWQRLPAGIKESINRIDARYDNGVAIRRSTGHQSNPVALLGT